ncbi:hypothetical protein Ssi03_70950 [Sphaerisporangium siamense]|uniref:HNH endonuclease n=1 Tax=Sphaerisporangium siamense TaxID=795645 RepID=A0A7W7D4P7_9ACTN|nr:hypothetical protein [Sphaerisporangium siamense]MBB4698766.1 hypothetical protein [Sphaerisporangium siamense]GII89105.1 hypothetical protein Ssi03_70950 [Sphaerisporangium siamense]
MTVPKWNDPALKAGTMIKTALWLVSEVGEGNIFTKEQHRDAFPGIAQADRRLRDLRDFGWVIHTNSDDGALKPEEQRFVKTGLPVWQPGIRRSVAATTITAKQRQAVFAADDYQCVVCGIAGGESYPDALNDSAVLSISRRDVLLQGERVEVQLVTECKRCRAGTDGETSDVGRLLSDIRDLDDTERARLIRWMERGRRGATPLDRAWTAYRRLPAEMRGDVRRRLLG